MHSFLMVKMASGMDQGRVRPTTTNDDAQHGGHPANTKSSSLGLQHLLKTVSLDKKTFNSRKDQRTNQKNRSLVGSDQQMQRLA